MGSWTAAPGLGSALLARFYLAFAATVIPAPRRRPAGEAVPAMAGINAQAVRAPFMVLFSGTAAACAVALVHAVVDPAALSPLQLSRAAAHLAGWAAPVAVNLPLNRVPERGLIPWERFAQRWARANTLRAVLSAYAAPTLLPRGWTPGPRSRPRSGLSDGHRGPAGQDCKLRQLSQPVRAG